MVYLNKDSDIDTIQMLDLVKIQTQKTVVMRHKICKRILKLLLQINSFYVLHYFNILKITTPSELHFSPNAKQKNIIHP